VLTRIITWSLEHRFAVLLLTALVAVSGVQAARELPVDAFPDTTPVLVQVNTVAPALSPEEIEQQVTLPVEQALGGLPGLVRLRSVSKFGFSQVVVEFDEDTEIYLARQVVSERLQTIELPGGVSRPELGPVSTGLGEVYHYVLRGDARWSLGELTTLHRWEVQPRLLSVPGVAEVNTWGGERRQFQVRVDPVRLLEYDLLLDDLVDALRRNNLNVGGGNLEQAGELFLVQGLGLATNVEEVGGIVLTAEGGQPVLVRDVAEVVEGHELRRGAVTANGEGEVVLGLAFLLMGESSHEVTRAVEARVAEIQPSLPDGVTIEPLYQRTELVDQVIGTVRENLLEGALLVVAVLFCLLGSLRAGLIVALAIPLSMLFAANAMLRLGIAGSLMSLGAIDFGLIVDSSVILVENSVRRLREASPERSVADVVREASLEVRRPTLFGELIITVVYLPILTLEGVEGKMFVPMALTVILALVGSMIFSLTLMPALTSLLLRRGAASQSEHDNLVMRGLKACYAPVLRVAVRRPLPFLGAAVLVVSVGVGLGTRLGAEFIPRLNEQAIVVNTVRLSGVSLEESVRYGTRIEGAIMELYPDEVRDVWTRTGTAEVATDPMGIEVSDVFLTLHPRAQWTRAKTQDELVALMDLELAGLPGMRMVFTQPIEMRMNEMLEGIRTDVGIRIYGDDLELLKTEAARVQALVEQVPGAVDVYSEQVTGQPVLAVRIDREAVARHGVPAKHVLEVVEALGGINVGEVRQGQRRFPLAVRLPEPMRHDPTALSRILLPTARGERVPLSDLVRLEEVSGASTITREWQRRRILVQCNVRGRDVGGFVDDLQARLEAFELPQGYHWEIGGQFEHLQRARLRLTLVVPLALFLVLALLYTSLGAVRDALVVFSGVPFAIVGGVVALWLRDMPFTISAAVGFIAVSGVAMLNGLVMVSTVHQLLARGRPLPESVSEAGLTRLRPVLMTALVAGLGFVPMALNTGVGAEVQAPLATVVIGGVISDNLLTLLVLPALYVVFGSRSAPRPEAA
jgi:heavy metal efflux system protein